MPPAPRRGTLRRGRAPRPAPKGAPTGQASSLFLFMYYLCIIIIIIIIIIYVIYIIYIIYMIIIYVLFVVLLLSSSSLLLLLLLLLLSLWGPDGPGVQVQLQHYRVLGELLNVRCRLLEGLLQEEAEASSGLQADVRQARGDLEAQTVRMGAAMMELQRSHRAQLAKMADEQELAADLHRAQVEAYAARCREAEEELAALRQDLRRGGERPAAAAPRGATAQGDADRAAGAGGQDDVAGGRDAADRRGWQPGACGDALAPILEAAGDEEEAPGEETLSPNCLTNCLRELAEDDVDEEPCSYDGSAELATPDACEEQEEGCLGADPRRTAQLLVLLLVI